MIRRLWWLEARQTVGRWLVLTLPLLWFIWGGRVWQSLPLWPETSAAIRNNVLWLGPLVAGVNAWVAGRDRGRGPGELFTTSAFPQAGRLLLTWWGTTGWGVLVYCLPGVGLLLVGASLATWGGPYWGVIGLGLLAMLVHGALGLLAGTYLPTRLAIPLVVAGLGFAQQALRQYREWYAVLSPAFPAGFGVWYGVAPNWLGHQLVFLLSLGALALALTLLRLDAQRWVRIGCVVLACAVVGSLAAIFWRTETAGLDGDFRARQMIPYQPVCAAATIPVCVHPAYQPWLAETTRVINQLLIPLQGLPGVPARAQQGFGAVGTTKEQPLYFNITPGYEYQNLAFIVSTQLLWDPTVPLPAQRANCPDGQPGSCDQARLVVRQWLAAQTGYGETIWLEPAAQAASARFAALDPATRRAWLAQHWGALRANRVPLGELP